MVSSHEMSSDVHTTKDLQMAASYQIHRAQIEAILSSWGMPAEAADKTAEAIALAAREQLPCSAAANGEQHSCAYLSR
jgi:hypothetical protein